MDVYENLHTGANFQELTALLALSDGSITSDPYMNTFFDSLNQGNRYLYLPPALPWNPGSHVPQPSISWMVRLLSQSVLDKPTTFPDIKFAVPTFLGI